MRTTIGHTYLDDYTENRRKQGIPNPFVDRAPLNQQDSDNYRRNENRNERRRYQDEEE